MRPRTERLGVAALLAGALVLHGATLDGQSLFVDEVSELLHARGTLAEAAFRADSMPPTYTLLLRQGAALTGEGKHLRWLSVAAGLAATLVVWRLGRRLGAACGADPGAVGLAAAAVFAFAPMQLYYAQLIRGYALTTLAAALAVLAFVRAVESDRRGDWMAFAAAGVFGLWCHYYFAVLLVLLLACLVLRRGVRVGRWPLVAGVAIVVGAVGLLPFLREDFGYQRDLREPRPLSPAALAYTGLSLFSGYTLGPSKSELHELGGAAAARQAAPWALAISIAAAPLAWRGASLLRHGGWATAVIGLTVAPTLVIGLVGAAVGLTFNPRFVAWCVVPLALWLGAGVAEGVRRGGVARWTTVASCGLLAVVFVSAIAQRHLVDRYRVEDLEGAEAWLAEQPSAPVLVVADYFAPQLDFVAELAGRSLSTVGLPRPGERDVVVDDESTAAEGVAAARRLAGQGGAFWLVESRAYHTDPRGKLRAALSEAATLETAAEFAGVRVLRGRFAAPR